MSALLERLAALTAEDRAVAGRVALQTVDTATTYEELLHLAHQRRLDWPQLRGAGLALEYMGLLDFCVGLLAFDGWCDDLWLAAPHVPPEEFARHMEQIGGAWVWRAGAAQAAANPKAADRRGSARDHDAGPSTWWLATSGTSGTPKLIGHTLASLSGKVRISSFSRGLRWGLVYQPCRFAGLQVVLQALLSGAMLVDAQGPAPDQRMDALLAHRVDALSATPSLWRTLLMTGRVPQLALKQLTLGGEIADQALLTWLRQLFPQAKLLHIYASTEAGVGFTVSDGQAGFPAAWLDAGPAAPSQMRIDDRQHLLVRPAAGAVAGIAAARLSVDGYLDTEDLVQAEGGRVMFLGRAGGVINVGGNKVHPEQIEQVILAVPGIVQVRVYGKSSSVLGQLVAADLVAAEPGQQAVLQSAVMKHCLKHLARYQVPAKLNWVTSLHAGDAGKMTRN